MIQGLTLEEAKSTLKTDFKTLHNEALIDVSVQVERQPIAIAKGSYDYKSYTNHIPLVSYGNFMCIVGASKSMKTFFRSALLAAYIGGNSTNYFNDMIGLDTKDKFILDFDTEQGKYHAQKVAIRTCDIVGSNYPFYKSFALRSLTPKERVEFIEWTCYESEYKNKIGLVCIDGVADLLENVNDLDKSNEITQKLMTLTEKVNCALITVLHRNFGTQKPTGHLGSAVLKKAETVCFIENNNGEVKVTPEYTRNIPFNEFSFGLDENYLPYEIESF